MTDMATNSVSDPQARVGGVEDYHFFYNPFGKAITVNEYMTLCQNLFEGPTEYARISPS